jgi:hypothetical protein
VITRVAWSVLLVACTKQQQDPQSQPSVVAAAASSSSSTAPATFPPIDDACKADSDCTATGLFGTCCGNCEQRYANKDYVTRAQAYCSANPAPSCPPMGCSWALSPPKCIDARCQATPASDGRAIKKSTSCKEGELTYLGFRGTGMPPRGLYIAVKMRFPDAMVYEVKDGTLGVFTAEPHSMDVRKRHEDAAAAVPGWKGDVVDFARVAKDCTASFHTPMPPP